MGTLKGLWILVPERIQRKVYLGVLVLISIAILIFLGGFYAGLGYGIGLSFNDCTIRMSQCYLCP